MMRKAPLVSILVTPFNQKDYIRQTLDSILMQRCTFDFEVIIGEDCSSDGTREICQEYADNYPDQIVLCLNNHNKGLLDNYFDVFLKAKGKYFADCGGDDYWLTDTKLQEQVDILENHANVSLVAGNVQLYNQKSDIMIKPASWINEDWFFPEKYGKQAVANYLNTNECPRVVLASSCFRGEWAREAYQLHPELFRGKDVVCEDLPLTLVLLLRGPFYISKNNWLVYRVLEKSLSHSNSQNTYLKGFAFSAFKQTLTITTKLGVPVREIQQYAYAKAGDFALYSFLKKDRTFSKEVQKELLRKGLNPSFKSRLLHFFLYLPRIAKGIRSIYLKRYPQN